VHELVGKFIVEKNENINTNKKKLLVNLRILEVPLFMEFHCLISSPKIEFLLLIISINKNIGLSS
jgi:hypothetical protein